MSAPARSIDETAMSTSRGLDHLLDRQPVDEHVEHRLLDRVRVQPLRHRQVALRVEVDQQHAVAPLGERDAEVQRRRRLRDAALLVREGDHLRLRRGRSLAAAERWDAEGGARDPCESAISVRLTSFLLPPLEVSSPPPAPARRLRPSPTPRPRGRAPAARRARPRASTRPRSSASIRSSRASTRFATPSASSIQRR